MVMFHSIFSIGDVSSLSYLHGKKLTSIQIMISVGLNSKNIVNNTFGIFNDNYANYNNYKK